jgi:hypothetical protein
MSTFPIVHPSTKATPESVYHHGFVQCVQTMTSHNTQDVPDIFSLDTSRLNRARLVWQDINIVTCILILMKQFLGPVATPELLNSFQPIFSVLIKDPSSRMAHITTHILHLVEKHSRSVLNSQTKTRLTGIIDATLCPSSAVYCMVDKKVGLLLFKFLQTMTPFTEADLAPCMLLPSKEPLTELAVTVQRLACHNKNVYKKVLNMLYEKLSQS